MHIYVYVLRTYLTIWRGSRRSYSAVSDSLAYWSPFLSERAAILAHV